MNYEYQNQFITVNKPPQPTRFIHQSEDGQGSLARANSAQNGWFEKGE